MKSKIQLLRKFGLNLFKRSFTKYVVVETEYGPVKGIQKNTCLGQEVVSFQKIPFMKPPVGKLRFKAPEKPEKWTEPLDATQEGPSFVVFDLYQNKNDGQLDAMNLNVFTRDVNPKELCPVLVWIHGGGFTMGSSRTEFNGPDFFMQKNVVFVSMNYRLGAFGFLSLNDESLEVPGNAGLKDQTMALEWVKDNIKNFGGDPESVTLFGESSGSVSVCYHLISDHSKGLFKRAIAMSGSAFNSTFALLPKSNMAERLAKAVGWNGTGGENGILKALEEADAYKIVNSCRSLLTKEEKFEKNFVIGFGPSIEPYITENCFIHKHPVLMAREAWGNDIDLVIGGCSNEGIMQLALKRFKSLDTFHLALPSELKIKFGSEKSREYGTKIKKLYYSDSEPSKENSLGFGNFYGDIHFWHGIQRTVLSRTNSNGKGKTFIYRFDLNEGLGLIKLFIKDMPDYPGACHADDLMYLFKTSFAPRTGIDSKHHQHIKMMISFITNFAKNGDPNVPEWNLGENTKWEPFTATQAPIVGLNIAEENKIIELPENERCALWNEIYEKENFEMY